MTPPAASGEPSRAGSAGLRYEVVWTIVAALVAVGAAFLPLINVLGYESAELFCVFTTISTAAIALKRLGDGTVDPRRDGVGEAFTRLALRSLLPIAAPVAVLLLNALRVPNCDPVVGLLLYLLLPVASTFVVVALVLPIALVLKKTRWRVTGYVVLILATIAMGVAHLLTHPPIFAFHPTIGYFAGSIYDEALEIPAGLVHFRVMNVAFIVVVLAGIGIAFRRRRGSPWLGSLLVVLVAAAVWGSIWANRFELRIESTRADIIEGLGGIAETEHFIIYYPLSDFEIAGQIELIKADHEFRYQQQVAFFGVEPEGPLLSFLYANADQKERFMGAGRTLIAKPWLREMHLTYDEMGDGHLAHEMAHLFSAAFGSGPLRLAGGTFGLDMGLIEGSAEAAAWDDRDLTAHGWSAAMYELDLAPDLAAIQGAAGFWTQYSRTVYTLMGSFSRWLIDEYGHERFRQVYATGDYDAAYSRSLDNLVADWRGFLESLPLSEADVDLAEFRFDRPSIFGKRCARSLAARAREGRLLASGLRYHEATECFEEIVQDDPDNLGYRIELARVMRQAGRFDDAEAVATEISELDGAGSVMRARATELLGDIAWSRGEAAAAEHLYDSVLEAPLLDDDRRRVMVKREAVSSVEARDVVYAMFLGAPPRPRDALTLDLTLRQAETDSWLLAYLLGLRMFRARAYERAVSYLEVALDGLTPDLVSSERGFFDIQRMAWLRRGQALFVLGRYDGARQQLEVLAGSGDHRYDARAALGRDWVERCDWASR